MLIKLRFSEVNEPTIQLGGEELTWRDRCPSMQVQLLYWWGRGSSQQLIVTLIKCTCQGHSLQRCWVENMSTSWKAHRDNAAFLLLHEFSTKKKRHFWYSQALAFFHFIFHFLLTVFKDLLGISSAGRLWIPVILRQCFCACVRVCIFRHS